MSSLSARRAWIEIPKKVSVIVPSGSSLSARRAWIEIILCCDSIDEHLVALRKESVDRNVRPPAGPHIAPKSLSARRAWIEIKIIFFAL